MTDYSKNTLHKNNKKRNKNNFSNLSLSKKILYILGRITIILLKILVIFFIIIMVGYIFISPKYYEYKSFANNIVCDSNSETFKSNLSSYIYDDSNNLIAKLSYDKFADYLFYDDIPENVINAYIAIEDQTFWEHKGYDPKAIARVCLKYISTKGEEKHGASTITQQLARSTFLTNEVSMERKIKEIFIAIELEKKYSKEEILEYYINNTYYANNQYGIKTAAKYYFDKDVDNLTLSETAYLCSIPNAPTYYNPLKDKNKAIDRRDKILKDMYVCNYITKDELDEALNEEIILNLSEKNEISNYQTTYAIDCVIRYLMSVDQYDFKYYFDTMDDYQEYLNKYNEDYEEYRIKLYKGGYKIYTSLNTDVQNILQNTIDNYMSFNDKTDENGVYLLQSAGTIIDNNTNKVIAIVGGRTQDTDQYTLNRAYQSYRQPGSSIKPLIVYTPILEYGYSANSIVYNIDIDEAKKKGVDINKLTGQEMTLRSAVENSKNGVAWSLFSKIGAQKGLSYLQEMQFAKIVPNDYYPASSLGGFTYGVTTVEMANGYSTLVNNGIYNDATCIVSFIDKYENEIYKKAESKQIYDSDASYEMLDILKGVLTRGTASKIGWKNKVDAAGKTGTTNNNKDGWFCGVTPDYSIAIWVGYDKPETVKNLYGATYPAKIWKSVMSELVSNSENLDFSKSADIEDLNNENEYEKYLPGRNDSEELSPGYTVKNYREDHALADKADLYINKIENLNLNDVNFQENAEEYYSNAYYLIEQIYGRTLYAKEKDKLENAYANFLNKL